MSARRVADSGAKAHEAFGFEEDRLDGAEERAGERLDGEGGLEVRGGAPTILDPLVGTPSFGPPHGGGTDSL
jgi:hypothetical protein